MRKILEDAEDEFEDYLDEVIKAFFSPLMRAHSICGTTIQQRLPVDVISAGGPCLVSGFQTGHQFRCVTEYIGFAARGSLRPPPASG